MAVYENIDRFVRFIFGSPSTFVFDLFLFKKIWQCAKVFNLVVVSHIQNNNWQRIRNILKICPFYFRSPNTSVFDLFVVSLARLEHIGASSFPFIPAPLKVFAFQKLLASLQMRMPVMDGFNGE